MLSTLDNVVKYICRQTPVRTKKPGQQPCPGTSVDKIQARLQDERLLMVVCHDAARLRLIRHLPTRPLCDAHRILEALILCAGKTRRFLTTSPTRCQAKHKNPVDIAVMRITFSIHRMFRGWATHVRPIRHDHRRSRHSLRQGNRQQRRSHAAFGARAPLFALRPADARGDPASHRRIFGPGHASPSGGRLRHRKYRTSGDIGAAGRRSPRQP